MRFVVALLFIIPILAGCTTKSGEGPGTEDPVSLPTIDGGVVNETAGSVVLEFLEETLPFEHTFQVPEGATMVRLLADRGATATVSVSMWNEDTGRRRCHQQSVIGFSEGFLGERSCSGITAIDPPGSNWTARVIGAGAADIQIQFLTGPLDGVAAMLDLSQLSQPTHALQPTQYLEIPSHDGTLLWTEVTLPVGPGPWPTVIAASPYNGQGPSRGETPAMWTYWTQDWAKRGYAAVNVDVRGFGLSGGCVEIWGLNEQLDQKYMVDWVAKQPWSDGNVGFYGQSYVGTTPTAAAVHAPEALKAIIAVAPVINAYEDWHYGGVPNGESSLSPVGYQVLTDPPQTAFDPTQPTDLAAIIANAAKGVCDPSIIAKANDPRAVYNDYYAERDFKRGVKNVKAAVLFTEGFEDANVKSAMIPGWFNEIDAPKLGIFGHWLHQHPARMDQEILFLGWMDEHVKGKDLGFDRLPAALVSAEGGWHRQATSWPAEEAQIQGWGLDLEAFTMAHGSGQGTTNLEVGPVSRTANALPNTVTIRGAVAEDLPIIAPSLTLSGTFAGENGFVHAALYEEFEEGGQRLLTWGRINLALRNGYDTYEPAAGSVTASLPFRPTEHIVAGGSQLRLEIYGVQLPVTGTAQPQPGVFVLDGSTSALQVPTLPMSAYEPMPITARP